ncbi:MAG: NAD(P)H-hydrate dehydratase [Sphingomicrobium sp.]
MRPILTAAAMRAAEQAAIAAGTPETGLMERAGAALAEAALAFAGPIDTLILCGPGNNGGDGYVAARHLAARGAEVRVAALADPSTDVARWAAGQWEGVIEPLSETTRPAPLLIDCLFGTGLKRGLDPALANLLITLTNRAKLSIACDLPSGVDSDSGALLSPAPRADLTLTLGALKPAHRLAPAIHHCGRVVLADIGIPIDSAWFEIGRPDLPPLDPAGHKYSRGLVHLLAGEMPGAIALSARAAARSGAGYVRLSTSRSIDNLSSAIVQTETAEVSDPRIGCLVVGPGLGDIPPVLTLALTGGRPVLIDADAIALVGEPERLRGHDTILTPHTGEFAKLFGELPGSKADQALAAARASGAVVVFKGPDTIVASPDGRVGFAPPAPAWLASAGTGDVLAGIIAAMRARGLPSFEAACAGVWLHGRAAERVGPTMIADDLVEAIPLVIEG